MATDNEARMKKPANPEYIEAMRQIRRSSATQRHTPRPRRGTRRQRELQAIQDQIRTEDEYLAELVDEINDMMGGNA